MLGALFSARNASLSHNPRAAAPAVNIVMLPKTGTLASGELKQISVLLQTGDQNNKISGFDLTFNTAGGMQIVDVTSPVNFATNDGSSITQLLKQVTGTQARLSYVLLSANDALPSTIRFTITVSGSGTSGQTLTLNQSVSQAVGSIAENTYSWGTIDQATFTGASTGTTITPTGTTGCSTPTSPVGLTPNGPITSSSSVMLSWNAVSGADTYTGTISDIGYGWVGGNTGQLAAPVNFTTNQTSYAYNVLPGHIYKWSVAAKNTSCGQQSSPNEAYIYVPSGNITPTTNPNATVTPSPTATANGTPSPTPTLPDIKFTFNIRFQGITTQPAENAPKIPGKITFVRNNNWNKRIEVPTNFIYQSRGIWQSVESVPVPPGDHYKILIRGEKHLQRAICERKPADQYPGSYKCGNPNGDIVIPALEDTFDFTAIFLFAGDIPFKGENDGVIDAFDISYIRTHLGTTEAIGDLNYDGVIDSQDYTIAIGAMQIQRQDEY